MKKKSESNGERDNGERNGEEKDFIGERKEKGSKTTKRRILRDLNDQQNSSKNSFLIPRTNKSRILSYFVSEGGYSELAALESILF